MVARKRKKPGPAHRDSDPSFKVPKTDIPYPYNHIVNGLPFVPYTCSKCGYEACAKEFNALDRSLPLLREAAPQQGSYSFCPQDEGPDFAELLSPTRDSWRARATQKIRGRTVTACRLGGILEKKEGSTRNGPLITEPQLKRELYLKFYLEDEGPLDDLNLECLVQAPYLHGRIFKVDDTFVAPRTSRIPYSEDAWEDHAAQLSQRIQGSRPGFLSEDIARVLDPRRGSKMFDENQFLAVPFNLSVPLQEQWDHIRPWLDDLADYAYRFTKTKRPRRRTNMFRDIYIFLAVKLDGRKVSAVAREVFRGGDPGSHQKTVREAVRRINTVVGRAGIVLPASSDMPMPK